MTVLIKSPPIPTGVHTFPFHVATDIYVSDSGDVFTHSMDLDAMAEVLCRQWQCRRGTGESRAGT